MFPKSKLSAVNDNSNSAAYSYVANSPLVGQITFKQSGATRMITTKQYDYLNRLTQNSSAPSGTGILPVSFNYNYNPANQTTNGNVAALVNASNGTLVANYEYGPFGEVRKGSVNGIDMSHWQSFSDLTRCLESGQVSTGRGATMQIIEKYDNTIN